MERQVAHLEASHVVAEEGQVIVDGPDGVAVTLSPDAAEETARRLMTAVDEARRQSEQPNRPRA